MFSQVASMAKRFWSEGGFRTNAPVEESSSSLFGTVRVLYSVLSGRDRLTLRCSMFFSTRIESSIQVEGEVKTDPRAPGGREIVVHSGKVDSAALEEFPIAKQFQGPDFLLDKRHLFVRSDKMRAVLKIRAVILSAARSWIDSQDLIEVLVQNMSSAAL